MPNGQTIPLKKSHLYNPKLYQNSRAAFQVDYNGGLMDGWSNVYVNRKPCPTCAYAYVDPAQIKPYWAMAKQYVLADHMFPTENSGDFSAHQDLIRGSSAIDAHSSSSTSRRTDRGGATLRRARRRRSSTTAANTSKRVRTRASPTRRFAICSTRSTCRGSTTCRSS